MGFPFLTEQKLVNKKLYKINFDYANRRILTVFYVSLVAGWVPAIPIHIGFHGVILSVPPRVYTLNCKEIFGPNEKYSQK